jgi:flavin-dependent dehydrogenase
MLRAPHALVYRAAAVFPDGHRITREYDSPGFIVPRVHLDDGLRFALQAAGARLIEDRQVNSLIRDGERIAGAEGPGLRWTAKLVIAADGYASVAWPALGVPTARGACLAVSATAYYRNVSFPYGDDTSDHFFDRELPYGYGWIFPAADGISNAGVYIRADAYVRSGKKLDALLDDFVARNADRFAGAERIGQIRTWSLPIAPRDVPIAAPGLLVAGDAAALVDPLTGEGIWQGLRSGMLAAEVAREALRRGALDVELCERYTQACVREMRRPSQAKAFVQRALVGIVNRKLYTSRIVRGALALGYRGRALEMTKR